MNTISHLSLPCLNISETLKFYKNELGCEIGRSLDVNLFWPSNNFYQIG